MEQQHIDHVMLGRTLSASSDIESGSCTADGSDERLLPAERTVPARPSLLGDGATDELSSRQQRMDDRLRTLCLCVLALAVLAAGAFFLRSILIRFVLALALYYLLTPLIDALSCSWGSCRVPRGVATVAALGLAAGALLAVGVVVVRSITEFAAHASQYNNRIHQLSTVAFGGVQRLQDVLGTGAELPTDRAEASQLARAAVQKLDLAQILVKLMGSAAHVFENLIYILLFLAFMLAGRPAAQRAATPVERQIFSYIRGKVQLWVTFGVLSFLLNFIPNVGMPTSVVLPMPLVLLDPSFHFGGIAFTFAAPIGCGLAIKDVLEPLLIGHRTSLQPVAVLMSIMVWGSVWGLTGMILAVPLTAVARMQLARLEHPLPRFMAGVLSGNAEDEDGGELRAEAANKMIIARELLAGPAAQQW